MATRTHSSHQAKTDILIGVMSVALYIILGLVFFLCLSIDNKFLRVVNRTLATTLLTFTAMTIAMHAVYGGFDVGRKKNKPVISALIAEQCRRSSTYLYRSYISSYSVLSICSWKS